MYGLPDDSGLINFDEICEEAERIQAQLIEITGDKSICIGVREIGKYEYEIWFDSTEVRTQWFSNFDGLIEYAKENYMAEDWSI